MAVAEERLITARDLFALKFVGDPQLSPDGATVAFVVMTLDEEADDYRSRIWLVPADGSRPPRPLTSGAKADTTPRWSPDGQQIASLSTRDGKPQLYLIGLAGASRGRSPSGPTGRANRRGRPTGGDWPSRRQSATSERTAARRKPGSR